SFCPHPGTEQQTQPVYPKGTSVSVRRRLMAGTSTTAVFVAALGALSSPAWAEPHPDVADRPPVTAPFSPRAATPSGSGTYPSPPVADADRLERTIRVAPFDEPRSREYFAVSAVSLDRELIDKVREIDGVRSVEVVDAAR